MTSGYLKVSKSETWTLAPSPFPLLFWVSYHVKCLHYTSSCHGRKHGSLYYSAVINHVTQFSDSLSCLSTAWLLQPVIISSFPLHHLVVTLPPPHVLLPFIGAFSIEEALCPLCVQMFTGSFTLMDRNIGYVSLLITDWGWPVLTLHLHSSVLNIVSRAYFDYFSAEWRRVGSNAPDSWECTTSCQPHLPAQPSWSHPKIPASLAQPARRRFLSLN